MKTKLASLLVVLFISTISCTAQRTITVEAQNSDISNNLDLQAVASTFGESKDLEDFERRLNDYDSQISNLDLNNDGEVDYLRVIENMENNVHVVVIQAVLDKDVFQDVATIVVEKRENRRTIVQIIGDPYLYGNDYIIEPVYVYTPSIFSFFWGYNYHSWYSPYYYGYYPQYYRNRHPFEVNFYLSHINSHINRDHRYYYSDRYRNEYADKLHNSMRRNDYGNRYPDRNFSSRNGSISNKKDFDKARNNNSIYERSGSNRPSRSIDNNAGLRNDEKRNSNNGLNQRINTPSINRNSGTNRVQDDVYQNRTSRPENQGGRNNGNSQNNASSMERSTQTNTSPAQTPTPANRNIEMNRNNRNDTYQQRPAINTNTQRREPAVTRENMNTRPAPVVNQPNRSNDTRTIERKSVEKNQKKETKSDDGGSRNNSERR